MRFSPARIMQHVSPHASMSFRFSHLPGKKSVAQAQVTGISSIIPDAAARKARVSATAICDDEADEVSSAVPMAPFAKALDVEALGEDSGEFPGAGSAISFDAISSVLTENAPSRSSRSDSDRSTFFSDSRSSSNLSDSSCCDNNNESLCSYRCLRSFDQEHQAVFSLSTVPDGGLVCAGLGNNQISLWRHSDATHLTTLRSKVGAGPVRTLLIVGDKLFSGHQDRKIRVWRLSKFDHTQHTLVATLPTLRDLVTQVASSKFSRKKKKGSGTSSVQHTDIVSALALGNGIVYSGSWDKTIKAWRVSDLKCLDSFVAHDGPVKAVAASKKTGFLYTASADSTIKVWKIDHGLHRKDGRTYLKHLLLRVVNTSSGVNALALSGSKSFNASDHDDDDRDVLYSGSSDSSISVWSSSRASGKELEAVTFLSGHTQAVVCLATLHDLLCSGSSDKTIRLWRKVNGFHTCLAVIPGHTGPIRSVALIPDKVGLCSIVSGSVDGQAKMWRIYTERAHEHEASSSSITGDGDAPQWKLSTIKHALDEGAPFLRLAFDTLIEF